MPAIKPVIFKCENDECKSRFMTPAQGAKGLVCPFCGNPHFSAITVKQKPKTEQAPNQSGWQYTGIKKDNMHLYRNGQGRERWIPHGDELLTHPAGRPDPAAQTQYEKTISKIQTTQTTKKNQSNYRKKRYQLIKEGKWKGSMGASTKDATTN